MTKQDGALYRPSETHITGRRASACGAALLLAASLALGACSGDPSVEPRRDSMISEDIGSVFQTGTDAQTLVEPGGRDFTTWR
jgi:hypothetical protein